MPFPIASDAVARAFQNIGNEWALLAAGDAKQSNAMTISWGSLGFIWQRPIVTALVRPQRHTLQFTENFDLFSISFFNASYHKALTLLGTQSGRNGDKIAQAGLTPTFAEDAPVYKEAYLTVIARKLYRGKFEQAGFVAPEIDTEFYPERDHHIVYYAEIVKTIEQ